QIVLAASLTLNAQVPAFEVASVKPADPRSATLMRTAIPSPTTLEMTGSIRDLIKFAFTLEDGQIVGGARWMSDERFDIVARTHHPATVDEMRLMLRRLLQ